MPLRRSLWSWRPWGQVLEAQKKELIASHTCSFVLEEGTFGALYGYRRPKYTLHLSLEGFGFRGLGFRGFRVSLSLKQLCGHDWLRLGPSPKKTKQRPEHGGLRFRVSGCRVCKAKAYVGAEDAHEPRLSWDSERPEAFELFVARNFKKPSTPWSLNNPVNPNLKPPQHGGPPYHCCT